MRARGMTDLAIAKYTGLNTNTWFMIKKGLLRPGDNLVNLLMKIMGDEIPLLFMGYYITEEYPKFVSADKYVRDIVSRDMHEDIDKVRKKGGKLRY